MSELLNSHNMLVDFDMFIDYKTIQTEERDTDPYGYDERRQRYIEEFEAEQVE